MKSKTWTHLTDPLYNMLQTLLRDEQPPNYIPENVYKEIQSCPAKWLLKLQAILYIKRLSMKIYQFD